MAGTKIRGITLEIDGDTSGLSNSLKSANSALKSTQTQLKDVERLLKLDPTNTDLLRQKQQLLAKQVEETKNKLDALKDAQKTMDQNGVDKNSEQYMALQREIISTESKLKDLEKAASSSNVAFQAIGATADQVSKKTETLANKTQALSTAAAGALAGLVALGYSAATSADDLNTLANQTGFSTEMLQKMEYASDLVDVSVDDMTGAMRKLKKNITSTSTDVQEAFATIGVSVTDASGEFKDAEDLFFEVAQGLSTVANETERDNLAMQIFGKSADSLAGIIDDGGAALREYGEEAEKMGGVLSQDTLDGLNAVNDQIDVMKMNVQAMIAQNGAKILEALTPLIDELGTALAGLMEFLSGLTTEQFETILAVLAVVAALSPLLSIISKVSSIISVLATTVIPLLGSALTFIAANPIVLLIAAITALIVFLVANKEKVLEIMNTIKEAVVNAWENVKNAFETIISYISSTFTNAWNSVWNGLKTGFSTVFNSLVNVAKTPLNKIIGFLNSVISKINSFISSVNKVTSKLGFSGKIGTIGSIPLLANGGILSSGSAIVGEAGPELLTMAGNKAVVQPLSMGNVENLLGSINGKLGAGETKIVVQAVLDGRVIGETAYKYGRMRSLSYGN